MKLIGVAAIAASMLCACQQSAGNNVAAGNAMPANAGAPAGNIAQSSTNGAVPDPAAQTGPVALASDATLPAPCQTVVRETQACIDNLSGAQAAFREEWLRVGLDSSRRTWASAQDDSYRGPVCEQDLRTLRQRVAPWDCAAR